MGKKNSAKTIAVQFRASESEKSSFEAAAELSGATLSAWIRQKLRNASQAELAAAGQVVPFAVRAQQVTKPEKDG